MKRMTRRYVLVKVVSEAKLTDQQFHEALNNSVRTNFGEFGFSRIDPKIIDFDTDSATGIVACERNATSELEAAIALITKYSEIPMTALVLRVSGTVKAIRKRKAKR
jgi:RNase P/RNase MRP subunit POP5